jgi:type VI secretion system secreted protein Hcp
MRRTLLLAVAVIATLGVAAIAFGAVPASDGTIGACFTTNENVRLVDDASQCREGETFTKWNAQGPKGDPGPTGPPGAPGAPGSGGGGGGGFPVPDADASITLDGVTGGADDAKKGDEIPVLGFDFGLKNPSGSGGSSSRGGGAGKATFKEFTFVHAVDKASPQLFLLAAGGKAVKKATLTLRKAGRDDLLYRVTLSDVLVSSIQTGSQKPGAGGPVEEVGLSYGKIEVVYYAQKGGPVKGSWDLKQGTK